MKNSLLISLEQVLAFSSKLIALELKEKKTKSSQVEAVRHHCERLAEAGIFAFETNCDDESLCKQIEIFAAH